MFVYLFVVYLEPGYYEDGAFGIRIENVLLVKPVELEVRRVLSSNYMFFSRNQLANLMSGAIRL